MTDDELIEKLSLIVLEVREVVAERDDLRRLVKDLQDLSIDQAIEIGQLKRRLSEI
jgi:hypothetical protein